MVVVVVVEEDMDTTSYHTIDPASAWSGLDDYYRHCSVVTPEYSEVSRNKQAHDWQKNAVSQSFSPYVINMYMILMQPSMH